MKINVNNLSFAYASKLVLNKLSFSLEDGEFLTVVGKNGTGKSTLVKCLLKTLRVPNDTIFMDNIDINLVPRFLNVGYVPQKDNFNYEFPISVSELLHCSYRKKCDAYFNSIINYLDIGRFFHENINNLSGGQIQRIFIARALLNKPRLLILDEPTVGVDSENIRVLHEILKNLKEQKVTIILITHDEEFSIDITDYVLTLKEMTDYTLNKVGDNQ